MVKGSGPSGPWRPRPVASCFKTSTTWSSRSKTTHASRSYGILSEEQSVAIEQCDTAFWEDPDEIYRKAMAAYCR